MKAVIVAGGMGTRLGPISESIPKSMIKIDGKPVINHQIDNLLSNGIEQITFCLGHQNKMLTNHINHSYSQLSKKIFIEKTPLGTGGTLGQLDNLSEDIIVVFGDIIFDIDIQKYHDFHLNQNSSITIYGHPNDHPHDSDLLVCDSNDKLMKISPKGSHKGFYANLVSSGIFILSPKVSNSIEKRKADFVNDILLKNLESDEPIFVYNSSEFIKDMGTPDRIIEVEKSVKSGILRKKNLSQKQVACFLDRDGTINVEKDNITSLEEFRFIDGSIEAIKCLNKTEFLVIVVTNQPGVAKGFCQIDDIQDIHNFMETELGKNGAKLDSIYFCPCHPEKGFKGENPKYKRECPDRKPNIGMLQKAEERFNIDIEKSYLIGDTTTDIQTARNAGLKSILVQTGYKGEDGKYNVKPDCISANLREAVRMIIKC